MTGTVLDREQPEPIAGKRRATPIVLARRALGSHLRRPVVVIVGSLLLVVAGTLPIWGTRLQAPQYPKGLSLWFYGGRVDGPVREVNGLNHYIGMRPIELGTVPELVIWPLAIVGLGMAFSVAVLWRGWIGRIALLGLWMAPVLILADIQRWLIHFGTTLDSSSALRLEPFVPLVIGPNSVWNFTVWTYPGPALGVIVLVAILATWARRAPTGERLVDAGAAVAGLALLVAGTVAVVVPAVRSEASSPAASTTSSAVADLQDLINEAPTGSTVSVPPGTYRGSVVVDRTLTIVAQGEVLLDGGGRGSTVTITAPEVVLRGFRIGHTGGQVEEAAAVKVVGAERVTIAGNHIEDFFTGIAVYDADGVRIVDNRILGSGQVTAGSGHATAEGSAAPIEGPSPPAEGSAAAEANPHAGHAAGAGPQGQGDAISLWSVDGALIRGNAIADVRDAIYLNYADAVLVDTNRITTSRYGLHAMFGSNLTVFGNTIGSNLSGLVLMYTREVIAGRNELTDHVSGGTGFGVIVKDVAGLRLAENVIARNRVGFQAEGTRQIPDAEASVVQNRLAANATAVALMATADLSFGGNAFDANLVDVLALEPGVERRNLWTHRGAGNAWSGYAGFDLRGDGVGDVPHLAGGVEQVVLAANPLLEVYRTSLAFEIMSDAQAVWDAGREPVVFDPHPLVSAAAPDASPGRSPDPPLAWQAAGALLVAGSTGAVVSARRRRRRHAG